MFPGQPMPRLYDHVVEVLRTRHDSRRTEQAYIHWIRRFVLFHPRAHPRELAEGEVNRFLTHLAVKENVAASAQNHALAALLFLYKHVLEQPLDRIEGVVRARKPKRLPAVLTRDEVEGVLEQLDGVSGLVCTLLYGSGLRLLEGLQLRVKDLEFGRGEITIREGKGQKDPLTMLPAVLDQPLQHHLPRVRQQHEADSNCDSDTGTAIGKNRGLTPFAAPANGCLYPVFAAFHPHCLNRSDLKHGLGRAPLRHALVRKCPNTDCE
jgi:site-specific recombinase XerD